VTQLSLERLPQLRALCAGWPDRLAAAVYVPVVAGFGAVSAEVPAVNGSSPGEVAAALAAFHAEAEAGALGGGCALDLELAAEPFASWADPALGLYPFNAARNRALGLARSEAVLLLDVDFRPWSGLPDLHARRPGAAAELRRELVERRTALVLPAFETADGGAAGRGVAAAAAARGKAYALEAWRAGEIAPFQVAQYARGHSATDYARWAAATQRYDVTYEPGYEPYLLVARRHVPFYDERFRGYGRDKIAHALHMAALGVRFAAHPAGYVVHAPHAKAPTFKATKAGGQWAYLFQLYMVARYEIDGEAGAGPPPGAEPYAPVTAFASRCAREVPVNAAREARLWALVRRRWPDGARGGAPGSAGAPAIAARKATAGGGAPRGEGALVAEPEVDAPAAEVALEEPAAAVEEAADEPLRARPAQRGGD
jgi:hypothetical protein